MKKEKEPLLTSPEPLRKGKAGDNVVVPRVASPSGIDPPKEIVDEEAQKVREAKRSKYLAISFGIMIVVGLGNKIFQKLQTVPMHNYPYFLTLYNTFIYIPASFAYIWPMILWGKQITPEQRRIPKYKFAIMGFLDGTAGIMQTFATTAITSGGLLILLQQAAIPISMLITKVMLKTKYKWFNYVGAVVVVIGLAVVLVPLFLPVGLTRLLPLPKHHHPVPTPASTGPAPGPAPAAPSEPADLWIWILLLVVSCVPMTLSSVYKEKALGEQEIDVVYLNGWVALFQFLSGIAFAVPAAYATNLPINQIPKILLDGARCYVGIDSVFKKTATMHVDNCYLSAPVFVNVYMAFNLVYNVFIILILKYGSSNILWLAMTVMVPLGNVAFAIPGIPGGRPMRPTDVIGLCVIMFGLCVYRFWPGVQRLCKLFYHRIWKGDRDWVPDPDEEKLSALAHGSVRDFGQFYSANQIEVMESIFSVLPEKKIQRSQQQIRSAYISRLGIGAKPPGYGAVSNGEPIGAGRGSGNANLARTPPTPPSNHSPARSDQSIN